MTSANTQRETVILDSINEGVFTVDKQWRITAFNAAAERITGIPRDSAIGSRCSDVFHATICEKDCALKKTLSNAEPILNAHACIVKVDGQQIPIQLSTAPLKNSEGKVIGGVETFQDLRVEEQLRKELKGSYTFEDIIGRSDVMRQLFELLPQVAESSATVLIEGPSGTGKELFARAIHNLSPRKNKPFIAVNCAALPDTLLESELFGHKAGAFTDARKDKPGRFALAEGGTIFLDEIGDISQALQVRLLRVLQERVIEPLGAIKAKPIDVRVIAATNKSLSEAVKKGEFREDLYYRVRVVLLSLPSLRQRREDIPLLVEHLVSKFNLLQSKKITGISNGVLARLMKYDFPGNVRELENIIEQAFVLCRDHLIREQHLPPELKPELAYSRSHMAMSLEQLEKVFITEALQRNKGNRKMTAAELGINASTLFRKIRKLSITPPETDGRIRP